MAMMVTVGVFIGWNFWLSNKSDLKTVGSNMYIILGKLQSLTDLKQCYFL